MAVGTLTYIKLGSVIWELCRLAREHAVPVVIQL